MWHEARKQEKKIRGLMVDYKRRAERRREFYEKIKLDPAQFVRVFGQACKINLDPAIAVAAESPQSMMPWQGDTSNMIDRFDVRAHLDIMPPEKSYTVELTKEQEDEERKANYERYRIIVENECAGLTEEQALQQLYFDELYGAINKDGEEEKNKLKDKKAAIGYVYEDSTKEQEEEEEDSEDSDEDIETLDLDMALDVDSLTTDQMEQLNICGTQFGMGKEDFIKYLQRDKDESEALKQAKLLEEEKAQFAGRKSRRERRIYKERRLAGRKLSPPSYAARDSPKYEPYRRSPSRSRSRSRSPPKKSRKMYITSFGENDDSDDGIGVVQGPELPPGLGTHKETEKKTEATCEPNDKSSRNRSRGSHSSERSPHKKDKFERSKRSRSRSRDYRSRRSRSRGRRSRSHDRRSRNGQDHRSRSREFNRRSHDRYSSERSRRRRSSDRYRSQRSRSRSRHSRSYERRSGASRHNRSVSRSRSKSRSRSRRSSVSSSSSSSRSRSSSRSSRSKSRSPVKPVIKSYRRESLSSKSDSESDSDDAYKPQTSRSNLPSSSRAGLSKPSGMFGKSASSTQVKAYSTRET